MANESFSTALLEFAAGRRSLGWELWIAAVDESQCLTDAGKDIIRKIGEDFQEWLGDKIIQVPHHILWSMSTVGLCPLNDCRATYLRILDLWAHIKISSFEFGVKRKERVLEQLRSNSQSAQWHHALLQLEIAGFAVRDGFGCAFEYKSRGGYPADVCIISADGHCTALVETVTVYVDKRTQEAHECFEVVEHVLWQVYLTDGVSAQGKIYSLLSATHIEELAAKVLKKARRISVHGGRAKIQVPGAYIRLVKHDEARPPKLVGPRVGTDLWRRTEQKILEKSRQAKGEHIWIRMDNVSGMFQFTQWGQMSMQTKVTYLESLLHPVFAELTNVDGFILSDSGMISAEQEQVYDHGSAICVRQVMTDHRVRETLILARGDEKVTRFQKTVAGWYETESTWLEWALSRIEGPPLSTLWIQN